MQPLLLREMFYLQVLNFKQGLDNNNMLQKSRKALLYQTISSRQYHPFILNTSLKALFCWPNQQIVNSIVSICTITPILNMDNNAVVK